MSSSEGDSDEEIRQLREELEGSLTDVDCQLCSAVLASNPKLCLTCQIWNDGRHVFSCMSHITSPEIAGGLPIKSPKVSVWPSSGNKYSSMLPLPWPILVQEQNCIMCKVIAAGIQEKFGTRRSMNLSNLKVLNCGPHHFQRHRAQPRELWTGSSEPCTIRCVLFLVVARDPTAHVKSIAEGVYYHNPWPQSVTGIQIKLHYERSGRGLVGVRRWESELIDMPRMKRRLQDCELNHALCRVERAPSTFSGFRLIDCRNLCVTLAATTFEYAALSYSWKDTQRELCSELTRSSCRALHANGGIELARVPKLMWDAINLCSDLDIRYLWIDRLCIVQDDKASKKTQIMNMNQIYSNAELTVIAAVDSNRSLGLPGVRGRPRQSSIFYQARDYDGRARDYTAVTIEKSAWNSRAWTYEERLLSHRCIYVTNDSVLFDCAISKYHLSGGTKESRQLPNYRTCVKDYTARHLTHNDDILHAFAGISNVLEQQMGTKFLFGLPVSELPQALLWVPVDVMSRRDDMQRMPSWSWAGWNGRVWYHTKFNQNFVGTLTRIFSYSKEMEATQMAVKETWFGQIEPFSSIANVNQLPRSWPEHPYFVPEGNDGTTVWRECPQNPWQVVHKTILYPPICSKQILSMEGALVFETSTATLHVGGPYSRAEQGYRSMSTEQDIVESTITDDSGRVVGTLMSMQRTWVDTWFSRKQNYDFIVICAGTLPRGDWQDYRDSNSDFGTFGGDDVDPWLLHVMLVEREVANSWVCRRVAIGMIETRCWKDCNPIWKTIVLV